MAKKIYIKEWLDLKPIRSVYLQYDATKLLKSEKFIQVI